MSRVFTQIIVAALGGLIFLAGAGRVDAGSPFTPDTHKEVDHRDRRHRDVDRRDRAEEHDRRFRRHFRNVYREGRRVVNVGAAGGRVTNVEVGGGRPARVVAANAVTGGRGTCTS